MLMLINLRIQVTGLGQRAAGDEPGNVQAVQTQQVIEPPLNGVSWGVADGLVQGDLVERASCIRRQGRVTNGFDCLVPVSKRRRDVGPAASRAVLVVLFSADVLS